MRKINYRAIIILVIMFLYLIASCFFLIDKLGSFYTTITNPIFFGILFFISILMFKNESVNKKYKFDILQRVILCLLIFFIIYFMSGLFIGFEETPYSRNIISIMKNIFIYGSVIIFQEYIRMILMNRSKNNKKIIFLVTLLFILIDISTSLVVYTFNSNENIFKFIVIYMMPVIAKHTLLSYLTYVSNLMPSLLYRFILSIYIFIVPYIPNFGWFLTGIIEILLPFTIYIAVYNLYQKKENIVVHYNSKKDYKKIIVNCFTIFIVGMLVILVSGKFKYQFIAIASNSMNPEFYRNDAIIVEKVDKNEIRNLKTGDIIAYLRNDTLIIHRIVKKVETLNGNYVFQTKGDNNLTIDSEYVYPSEIVAKYKFTIPKIAYPSVWVSENILK